MRRVHAALVAFVLFHGVASAKECLNEGARGVTLTGVVYAVEDRRPAVPLSHWILKPADPVCLVRAEGEAPRPLQEVQLVFAPGSPYYEVYHALVGKRSSFRVTGAVSHAAVAYPVRSVLFDVEDFVPWVSPATASAPAPHKRNKKRR